MATHSSILAWRIPWIDEPGALQSTGSQRVRHNQATFTFNHLYCPALTSIHDYRKNHSFDYTDLCWQSVREQFLGPHRWGRNEVRPSSNLDIKSGLEPGPGILSRTVQGLHRVWAALGRQGAGCCWMTMAFLENLGEVQN